MRKARLILGKVHKEHESSKSDPRPGVRSKTNQQTFICARGVSRAGYPMLASVLTQERSPRVFKGLDPPSGMSQSYS